MDCDHESEESVWSSGVDRRKALRSFALGTVAMIAGNTVFAPFALGGPAVSEQPGWRWCHKCQGMFYAVATAGKGVCPADHQPHDDAGSGQYRERVGEDATGRQQGGWRWCKQCQGLFYARASAGKGVCPAGGTHDDSASGHYAALIGEDAPGQQGGWRWCGKCEGMFYARASAGKGVCPAGGAHSDSGSGHYASLF